MPAQEEDELHRFELDLQTSNNPLLKGYQHLIKQSTRKTPKNVAARTENVE